MNRKAGPSLTLLLKIICSPLPELQRRERLHEWLGHCEESARPHLEALSMVPAVVRLCWQYQPGEGMQAEVHWSDRLGLLSAKVLVLLLAAIVLLYALGLALAGPWNPEAMIWIQTRLMAVVVGAWIAWAGLGHDVPWLRCTRGGSAVLLMLVSAPVLLYYLVPSTQSLMSMAWLPTIFCVLTWDAYWNTRKPLKKIGILARRR